MTEPVTIQGNSSDEITVFNNDWYVNSEAQVEINNQTIVLNGNLIINSTGILNIKNSTIILNNTLLNPYYVKVKSNGTLNLKNSIVEANSNQSCSMLILNESSTGEILDTDFINLGLKPSKTQKCNNEFASIIIKTNDLKLNNCVIENTEQGILIDNSSPKIANVHIKNVDVGIFGNQTKSEIINCSFDSNKLDLKLMNKSSIIIINSNIGNSYLDNSSSALIKLLLNISVSFKTPYLKAIKNADVIVTSNGLTVYSTWDFGGEKSRTDDNGRINSIPVAQSLISGKNVTNFVTKISVRYKTREELNRTIVMNSSKTETFLFNNELPNIIQPMVTPWTGYTKSPFTYEVKYSDKDGDSPSKIQVEIDDKQYNMSKQNESMKPKDINWKNGSWLQYNTTLPAGEHKFRFITNDGLNFPDIITPNGKIEYLEGPSVEQSNSKPILSDGSVSPKIGNPDTIFRFQIKYWDAEGNPASMANIYVDNVLYTLKPTEATTKIKISTTGVWYELKTKLSLGEHDFYFKFKDTNNSEPTLWPCTSEDVSKINGPIVKEYKNKHPVLGNGTVTPTIGHRLNIFSYTISYYDFEGDLPSQAIVVIDGVPVNLTRARIAQNIYFYETPLSLGEHYYHFEFWDQHNDHYARYPEKNNVEVLGPIVIDIPPKLMDGSVSPLTGDKNTTFEFNIYYEDFENDLPKQAEVVIDNQSFKLNNHQLSKNLTSNVLSEDQIDLINNTNSLASTNSQNQELQNTNILKLSLSTKLELGKHSYYFLVKSVNYILRYPKTGSISGPDVIDTPISTNDNPKDSQDKDHKSPNSSSNENNSENKDIDNSTNFNVNNNTNTNLNDSECSSSDLYLIIKNYSVSNIDGFPLNIFEFKITCKIFENFNNKYNCLVYIDDVPYQMSIQENRKKNILIFNVILELSEGEHYYHFSLKVGESNVRVPFKGELGLSILGDNLNGNDNTGQLNIHRINDDHRQDIAKVMLIILFILAVLYFSFYRKYLELKMKEDDY